jgi:acetolactate decarboxylase
VLAAGLERGSIAISPARSLILDLPVNDDFAKADQVKDRAAELHQVETERR